MNNQVENLNIESDEIKDKITEDLSHLYNYPSIGKLFSDSSTDNLQSMKTKLNATKEKLDLLIRRGSNEEAQKATKALTAISLTLEFLQTLEKEKENKAN